MSCFVLYNQDADLSEVFGSLFGTLYVNLETQVHLQKTMGSLTQESNVDSFDSSHLKTINLKTLKISPHQ